MVFPEQNIRLACESDVPFLEGCTASAYSECVSALGHDLEQMTVDYIDLIDRRHIWVLEARMHPVALLVLKYEVGHLLIGNIAVLPKHQCHGHGRSLMQFADKEARRQHYHRIRLYMHEYMKPGLQWYHKLGYVETRREYVKGSAVLFMEKVVHAAGQSAEAADAARSPLNVGSKCLPAREEISHAR